MKKLLPLCLLITGTLLGQSARYDNNVITSAGNVPYGAQAPIYTLPFSTVTVCSYPADQDPCTNATPIYSDQGLTQQADNPITSDVHGRFGFWIAPGTYAYSVASPSGANIGTYALTVAGTAGSGGPVGATNYSFAPVATTRLVTDGDSVTAGAFLSGDQPWPNQLTLLPFFSNRATLINAAVSGQGCAAMTARYPSVVQPNKPNGTSIIKSYLTVLIGRNDYAAGASALEACIDAYVTQAKADGFTVTLMTILPSAMVSVPFAGFSGTWDAITYANEQVRVAVNDYIRRSPLPDNVFDFAAELTNPYDINWTVDGTHPTAALDALIARHMNTFFSQIQASSAVQNSQPIDSFYSPIFNGFTQAGNGAGGDFNCAANMSLQIIPNVAGLHCGWNFDGTQAASLIAVPLTGNGVGINFYTTHADGTTPTLLGTLTASGFTTANVTANGTGGPGTVAGGLFAASTAMTSPFYRGAPGQPAYAQGGAASTYDLAVKNVAGSANVMLVDEVGNTAITGRFSSSVSPPATSTTTCTAGQFADGVLSGVTYHFACYATNLWARVAMTNGGW